MFVDQLADGDSHRYFVVARSLYVPTDAKHSGAGTLWWGADRGKPFGATAENMRQIGQRFDVVHDRGFVVQAVGGRKGGLHSGEAAFALQ